MELLSDALFYVPYIICVWAFMGVLAWTVIRLFCTDFPKVSFLSSILSGPVLVIELIIISQIKWMLKHTHPSDKVDGEETKD